ncbi:MAG: sensor histidine kinase [Candidatus Accumulibacter meliphilus]|jgi:two-component system sensor histidine kinase RegB|uniref:histidine kinase n=1 Tax=Candidatus Accumulibacter meliphilus TaxID=2211374 RepID=A0A369XRK3_9PROT|nr:MAG: sensor histidine kinase [Candidatus Accumulibacter meliphilus]
MFRAFQEQPGEEQEQAPAFMSGSANPLARVLVLRRIEVLTQAVVLLLAVAWLKIPLDVAPMMAVIALLAAVNLLTRWRLARGGAASEGEVFAHLAIDVAALGVLLYFAGGSANPFVSLFLLPPTLAAAMLPARYAWSMAAMTLAAYTFLIFWKLPLPPPQGDLAQFDALLARATGGASEHAIHSSGFALHILGMWLNFVISVGVVAFFLTRMAAALKQRERELAVVREAVLRDEQILSLGTLAAGAAHQLGTPLATMAVVIRELELNHGSGDTELREDLLLLREQVDRCKQTISQILASSGQGREESLRSLALDAYLQHVLDDWQLIRPHARLSATLHGAQPAPLIAVDRTLEQALLNLLDNAADAADTNGASQEVLRFTASWDIDRCRIEILDAGPGLDAEARQRQGEAFFTTKVDGGERAGGLGIGLFLSNATLERLGGKVELFNREPPQGGACTRVTLPLARLKAQS